MNWIDTSLLVYAVVDGHPAKPTVQQLLRRGEWGSSVVVLLELAQVLNRDYGIPAADVGEVVTSLANSRLQWASLDLVLTRTALVDRLYQGIQPTDAVLLTLAGEDRGTLVTADRRLVRRAEERGVAVQNPISLPLSVEITRWEATHLPPKGLRRILVAVERWLRREDAHLADRFLAATEDLRSLPKDLSGI